MYGCEMFEKNCSGISLDIFNYMFVNYSKTFYRNTYKDFKVDKR
jgi:hypothetical protein